MYNLTEEQDKARAAGKHLCADCKNARFQFFRYGCGNRYSCHRCAILPGDGFYTARARISYITTAEEMGCEKWEANR